MCTWFAASWRRFRYDKKCLFSCIYNPQITISPTLLFSANFKGNRVKYHSQPWTCRLRRCPLPIAQRLVHCAAAVSTAVLGQSQGQCPLHCCWRTTRSERSPTFAAQLHLPTHDLFWANLKVQLHLPPLRSLDLLISPTETWWWWWIDA